jgi:AMP-polyphosphate phosphotransferase
LPQSGQIVAFDRSWYGRVLVERVEGLATNKEWRRAYREINEFERMLIDSRVRLVKLFLHITPEEQVRRFRDRLVDPLKHGNCLTRTFEIAHACRIIRRRSRT